ncbi:MAG TPA: pilus assembly protein N-terminal domain-containing protein [Rhizomicrobium sp.]|nr:pilus assembly protein N-terminal domain-containing protein [Rhizomicrobium sp.]
MRRTLFAALVLFAASPAYADGVAISMDEVRTITFPKPVATVYVGNPAIADINMIDSRHAFVLGKGFGNTNIVALDHQGDQVSDTHVRVMAREDSTVTLQRGAGRLTYSCTASHCEATPEPGDAKDAFDAVNSQVTIHEAAAKGAATGAP